MVRVGHLSTIDNQILLNWRSSAQLGQEKATNSLNKKVAPPCRSSTRMGLLLVMLSVGSFKIKTRPDRPVVKTWVIHTVDTNARCREA
jgi:hypothetical protein